jgi:hypothetical protein
MDRDLIGTLVDNAHAAIREVATYAALPLAKRTQVEDERLIHCRIMLSALLVAVESAIPQAQPERITARLPMLSRDGGVRVFETTLQGIREAREEDDNLVTQMFKRHGLSGQ